MFLESTDIQTTHTAIRLAPAPVPDLRDTDSRFGLSPVRRPDGEHPFKEYVNRPLAELLGRLRLDKQFVRGKGCELYDDHGHRYLDCIAAYGALPFGFNPPEIWAALYEVELSSEPSLVQPSLLRAAGELAARLAAIAPGELSRVTFANSGAEAVEAAVKLCRAATGRLGILTTDNSFHGKTLGALSATGNDAYQQSFGAPAGDFHRVPFGDAEALRQAFEARPGYFAAFLVEPIQGEGGIVEPPPGYLAAVREICDEHGVLVVFDEIQTGLGRTGTLFACEHDGVAPDVMTLAKALGGGLLPIGAVLCTPEVYNETFALKHSSTFAGNTLACRAGLAALELLQRDGGALLRNVQRNGARLKRELEKLRRSYPHLIAEVRGRDYMLGLRFHADRELWPQGLLGVAAEQDFFTPIFASYLLNVEGIRVAPTLNGNAVIRIEPALNFTWAQCEELLRGLERTLEAFSDGEAGPVFAAILEGRRRPRLRVASAAAPATRAPAVPRTGEHRFAFLMHPLNDRSHLDFEPSLNVLTREQLVDFADRIAGIVEPFVVSRTRIAAASGRSVYGEFIGLPWTAGQFADMDRDRAVAAVKEAIALAHSRGAQLVGLGAFTSIVTNGGLSVSREAVPVTTGNSYTAVASAEALGMAMNALGEGLAAHTTAAVIGSTGAIGRAMAMLLAEHVGRLVLIGNPDRAEAAVRRRLLGVATDICRHLATLIRQRALVPRLRLGTPGTLADRLLDTLAGRLPDEDAPPEAWLPAVESLERSGAFVLTRDMTGTLPLADAVVAATSATGSLVAPRDLRPGAVVCDLSRPANVGPEVTRQRPDVLVIDGGVIAVPDQPDLGPIGLDRGLSYACMAETMMLTLDGRLANMSLGVDLSAENLRLMRSLADRHGFHVARLRSHDRLLEDADWNRLLAARVSAGVGPGSAAA